MANDTPPPTSGSRTGLSLYANLLDPNNQAPGTISGAPVTYNKPADSPAEDEAAKKQNALAASLRFQPTKRPQLAAQKAKAKAIASKLAALPKPAESINDPPAADVKAERTGVLAAASTPLSAQKSTVADWTATVSDDEDINAYYASTRQRGGRKKRKKNKDSSQHIQHDWDDIYDPSRPNTYEEYKHSDEKIREVREWKDLLYRHRMQRKKSSDHDSDSDTCINEAKNSKQFTKQSVHYINLAGQFVPPPSMSFAPPASFTEPPPPPPPPEETEHEPPAAGKVPGDTRGEDAWARRMQMTGKNIQLPPPATVPLPLPGQIARAPVRYNLPSPDPELPANEAELQAMDVDEEPQEAQSHAPKSLKPGQAKFAERLMAKYGWSKGQGLGKEGTGVTSALYAKVDKRKKKSDAEGGGYVTPVQTGRIMGGTKSRLGKEAEEGKFGAMSEIVRLEGMLQGMDIQAEMMRGDGNIMQEIGEECGDKYGNVERVYIHSNTSNELGAMVFIYFTQPLSALRAVNALEGRVFNGNEIRARFWPKEKFDQAQYE
ncbi:hypothetical protein LTR64_006616 [Lithohypha guttulata]|uniref:uncharacterized protein n=1 Tax=Lithohypha guttulata TaxID=1690604 RepID=UPI002DDFE749|nr:hypothetical protein LTR51_004825 [Lithohypha guttulata]